MKIEVASVAATKLLLTGTNSANSYREPKIKACPGLFHRALVNYYCRIEDLYKKVVDETQNRNYKIWYCWQDGIKIIIINKNFGAIYTGSVVYGFKISDEEQDANAKHNFEFEKYYSKGKNYIKRSKDTVFEIEAGRYNLKVRGVWTGFRAKYREMSQKEIWQHNLETIQRVRGCEGYCDEFVDGYSKAINEYLATL